MSFSAHPLNSVAVLALASLAVLAFACAKPPPIVGAPCPCGEGYVCEAGACQVAPASGLDPAPSTPSAIGPAPACGDPGPNLDLPLAADEYRNTVRDLLGVTLEDAELPPELWKPTYPPGSDAVLAPIYQALAQRVAERAAPGAPALFACSDTTGDRQQCLATAIQAFGTRVFRRPIGAAESDLLLEAYRQTASDQDPTVGPRAVIEAALSVPAFYRRRLSGRPFDGEAPVTALDPWEMASRLSYLFWRSMPDKALFAAAANGQLERGEDIDRQARRLLEDSRTAYMLTHFLRERLEVGVLEIGASDLPAVMPPEVQRSTLGSLAAFGEHYILRQNRPHADLMTLPEVFADRPMSSFYGLEAPVGDGFEPVVPRADQIRRGLVTSPAWLARFAHGEQSAPVLRGSLVSRRFLCDPVPPPPPGTSQASPQPTADVSTRQKLEQHSQDPSCSTCHERFDPIGFGLENYDGLGRWRTHEGNQRIDPSGIVNGTSFHGPGELAQYLASKDAALDCVVLEWFRFAFGRPDQPLDGCTLEWLKATFREGGQRTHGLLLAIPQTSAFRQLRTPHHPAIP